MTGFADVIDQALPYLARERIDATQGTTWNWSYEAKDSAGTLVDMTTGFTATMKIYTRDGTLVLSPTVTFPSAGIVTCNATAAATAAVAPGAYLHELTITRTSDSAKVVAVGSGDSRFTVKKKVS